MKDAEDIVSGGKKEEEFEDGQLAPSQITYYEVQICENHWSN